MFPRPTVKRTYASRPRQYPSSPHTSSPPATPSAQESPIKRKRPLLESSSVNEPPQKRANIFGLTSKDSKPTAKPKAKASATSKKKDNGTKKLTQLHFVVDNAIRSCPLCSLSYTKGAVDDEMVHKKHCARVQRGLEWGKEEEKESEKAGVRVIEDLVRIQGPKGAIHGRTICVPADATGRIGSKISNLLETINFALSAPSLTPEMLKASKVYLFLTPSTTGRERIAGCVVAQRITKAMNVIPTPTPDTQNNAVRVDGGLYCSPQLHATPLGIPRLFVPSTHRRQGIAKLLLDAAAKTFVHGYALDPSKGQVAFSQPTGDGRKVMEAWGKGGVRIYQE
ncbi:hypothetical protein M422DRAFT_215844 [Sphaerobolus stellatus SS14]|uniref:N-acetyltransferase ECO1 n=1 Tax=Sphaerobolus stellatus (strain SS14) TaxID=990650 RepID=A0A0C9TDZ4_SPHS4|nr:hypothetical protein M422DRAFT_215844 [Sphaerobolus stellatus SS14]